MKKDAWRRQPSSYTLQSELMPRYTDVDLWQHLNNAALISMHGENCQRWLRGVFGTSVWRQAKPAIATLACATDFLAEGQYPEPLTTGTRLLGFDADSFRLASALFQNGSCVGLHDATLAVWDQGQPLALPSAVIDALQAAAAQQNGLPALDRAAPEAPVPGPIPTINDLPWRMSLSSRFSDSDARSQTSDASVARYAEQARVEFLTQVFGDIRRASTTGFIVGHVAARWLRRSRPAADWQTGCGVTRLGDRSITVRGALFDGDVCHAVYDTVMVVIDRETRRSAALPDDTRALLETYRLRGYLQAGSPG